MKSPFKILPLMVGLCGLFLSLAAPPQAHAQALIQPVKYDSFDNVPSIIEGSSTSNVVSTAINVHQGRPIHIWPYFNGTNASTANIIFAFTVTYDGTNWSTTTITTTNAMNGTTAVRGHAVIPAETLEGVKQLRLQTIENVHTASVFLTNVVYSISNK